MMKKEKKKICQYRKLAAAGCVGALFPLLLSLFDGVSCADVDFAVNWTAIVCVCRVQLSLFGLLCWRGGCILVVLLLRL